MKKNIIFIASFISVLVSCSSVKKAEYRYIPVVENTDEHIDKYFTVDTFSYSQMEKDLETVSYIFKTTYVGYDSAKKNGFDIDKSVENIKSRFNPDEPISKTGFLDEMYNEFEPYLNDSHLTMQFDQDYKRFSRHYDFHASDIFVEDIKGKLIVVKSDTTGINVGDVIKVPKENLFPVKISFNDDKKYYQVCSLSKEENESLSIMKDNNDVKISLTDNDIDAADDFVYEKVETENSIYYSINSFAPFFNNHDEVLDKLKDFNESASVARNKDYVIIDVRNNGGGDSSFVSEFIKNLCGLEYFVSSTDSDCVLLSSPAGLDAFCRFITANYSEGMDSCGYFFQLNEEQKSNPYRAYLYSKPGKNNAQQNKFKGKLIVITNRNTASSGEDFVLFPDEIFNHTDNFMQIGENTEGCSAYGDVCFFALEESGIVFCVPIMDFTPGLKKCGKFNGEGKGFYPDYWSTNKNLNDTILYITHDEQMHEMLKDLF